MAAKIDTCPKCGGDMQPGVARVGFLEGTLIKAHLDFFILDNQASWNPIKSFKQGLAEEPADIFKIRGTRCAKCGFLELYASD